MYIKHTCSVHVFVDIMFWIFWCLIKAFILYSELFLRLKGWSYCVKNKYVSILIKIIRLLFFVEK